MNSEIELIGNNNDILLLNVVEQTIFNGTTYVLALDKSNNDICYILKDISNTDDDMSDFIILENENELNVLKNIFNILLKDDNIEIDI